MIVARVEPGGRVHHEGRVAHRSRERADMVQTEPERQNTPAAHPPESGLQPDATAVGCRDPDRSAGIGAHGEKYQVRRDRRSGASTRPARYSFRVARIPYRAEMWIITRDAVCQLV